MAGQVQRLAHGYTPTLDSTLADTPVIPFEAFAGGVITIPTGSSITSLLWYGSPTIDGTYVSLYQKDNSAVVNPNTVAAARVYPFPDEAFGIKFLKIVPNADGAASLQLKS